MAIIDDLISSGLSLPQAQQVILEDTTNVVDGLVAAGFSPTAAAAMAAVDAGTSNGASLVEQGIWAGTQVPAIVAALAVTP
jgi:hypothetical protein